MSDLPEKWIGRVEAAEHCGLTLTWIRDNWRPKAMPFVKVGGLLRTKRSHLDNWMSAQKPKPLPLPN